jgi:dipeptidyl aminopeptidase/acylaminoacyl peptidase
MTLGLRTKIQSRRAHQHLSIKLFFACVCVIVLAGSSAVRAQQTPTPRVSIDDDCTAIAYASDGRLAYATRHVFNLQKFQVQRDDIWILETDGRRRKILNGEKVTRGSEAFSYTITRLRWSPDGTRVAAELVTTQVNAKGEEVPDNLLLFIGQDGKDVKIADGDNVVRGAIDGTYLIGNGKLAYLTETVKPNLMFSITTIESPGGHVFPLFDRHSFAALAWNAKRGTAVAIEKNLTDASATRLVELNLMSEDYRRLATLDSYVGGLSFSPSAAKVAYFRDINTLEIRDMTDPALVARVHVAYGTINWAPDEKSVLVKRGLDRQEGDLVWVQLPTPAADPESGPAETITPPTQTPILNGQTFRDFALAPDGHSVAVILLAKHNLQIFDLP